MANLVPSPFCKYELEPDEAKRGMILNTENLWVIQNMIAQYAQEKIDLTLELKHSDQYWQREAVLRGSIDALQSLVDNHNAALAEALEAQRTNDQFYQAAVTGSPFSPSPI